MFKGQEDIEQFALEVDSVDVESLLTELLQWQRELDDMPDDNIRYAMIDTFIDMLVDNCNM